MFPAIWAFINQKGGVGKTTLAVNVAACLTLLQQRVLFIDADTQGTSNDWALARPEWLPCPFKIEKIAYEEMASDIIKMAKTYDFTVIDCPPHADTISRSCIAASNVVAVHIEPGGASKWSSAVTIEQIKQAQEKVNPSLKCGFVVSRKIPGTCLGRDARANAASLGIPIFDTEIEQRIAFNEAMTLGKTIFEYAPSSAAVYDIHKLTHELLDLFKSTHELTDELNV